MKPSATVVVVIGVCVIAWKQGEEGIHKALAEGVVVGDVQVAPDMREIRQSVDVCEYSVASDAKPSVQDSGGWALEMPRAAAISSVFITPASSRKRNPASTNC